MEIKAKPHLNGNPPEHFKDWGRALLEAGQAAEKALTENARYCHGRNYQHLGLRESRDAQEADLQQIQALHKMIGELKELGIAVYREGETYERSCKRAS